MRTTSVDGPVALTPIQHWFFEQHFASAGVSAVYGAGGDRSLHVVECVLRGAERERHARLHTLSLGLAGVAGGFQGRPTRATKEQREPYRHEQHTGQRGPEEELREARSRQNRSHT